jgi:hypothetical protein
VHSVDSAIEPEVGLILYSALHFFNLILPERGYVGQTVKLYGATFFPRVNYYATFGELEPTPTCAAHYNVIGAIVHTQG